MTRAALEDIKIMKNAIAQKLQTCIQLLGPMPDEIGSIVKEVIHDFNPFQLFYLDGAIGRSITQGNYQPLQKWKNRCP